MIEFSHRLKYLRKERGYNQIELAKELGVRQSTISAWENGTFEPTFEKLLIIARYFNVSVNYLLGLSETKKPAQSADSE